MMRMILLYLYLVYTFMGCAVVGVEAEYIKLSRDDLKFLIAEVTNSNAEVTNSNEAGNCSLNFGAKEQLDLLTNSIQKIAEALTSKKNMSDECRDCFTMGSQTFVAFPTRTGSWDDAKDYCEERGFVLPEPRDPNKLAKHLRAVIDVEQNYYWVGGRGDGTRINWLNGGGSIDSNSKWWWSTHPGTMVTSAHCLVVVTHNNPSGYSTLYSPLCDSRNYFICEKV